MRYAILDGEVVTNVIEWDGEGNVFDEFNIVPITEDLTVGPGWVYSGGQFERIYFE